MKVINMGRGLETETDKVLVIESSFDVGGSWVIISLDRGIVWSKSEIQQMKANTTPRWCPT
jgi:hypothetical protein